MDTLSNDELIRHLKGRADQLTLTELILLDRLEAALEEVDRVVAESSLAPQWPPLKVASS